MDIEFKNFDTGKKIKLSSDKSLIIVYGKNGSGKTTLSRQKLFDKIFVFNEDFIFSNVYNISEDGASQTVKTKENFSGLWLGEDIVKIRKEITKILAIEKKLKDEYQQEQNKLNDFFMKHQIPIVLQNKLNELDDKDFKIDINKIAEQRTSYITTHNFKSNVDSKEKFIEKLIYLKKNDVYNMLISKIKDNSLLSEIILKENHEYLKSINIKIGELNKQQKLITEIEKIYKEDNINNEIREKIKDWYSLHENRDSCLFCGNTEISTAIEKWKKIFSNQHIQVKSKILSLLKSDIEYCKTLVNEKRFIEVDKEVITCVENTIKYLETKYEEVSNNIFTLLDFKFDLPKKELLKRNELINNLVNYTLEQKKNILGFYFNSTKNIALIKKEKLELADKLMDEKGNIIANKINDKFKDFGLNKSIEISVDKRSTPHKFTYSLKNHQNVNELSDGQKHKLALAIFMNYLEEQDLKNKIIVIDDPVVSLDITSYILFKQYLISKLIQRFDEKTTKLIILTHDISYLYIQVSNIFENESMKAITGIFKLNENQIDSIPLNYIKTDDITLFRDALDHLSNLKELIILNSIINKIFRIELDLRLRFFGISLTNTIGIEELLLPDEKKSKLREAHKHIVKTSRRNNPSYEKILESFKFLKESSEILGFSDFVTENHILKIKEIIDEGIEENVSYEIFHVISSVQKFLKSSDNEEMKKYVDHTRNSYTRNLIGLNLDDYFEFDVSSTDESISKTILVTENAEEKHPIGIG